MEELRDDIKMHLDHCDSTAPADADLHRFWEAVLVVCESEIVEARRKDAADRARVRGEEPPAEQRGLHSSVEADVKAVLDEHCTYNQLEALQLSIESLMRTGQARVVEFYEAVLTRLPVLKAKACLKELYTKMPPKYVVDDEENLGIAHGSRAEPMEEEEREEEDDHFRHKYLMEMKMRKSLRPKRTGPCSKGSAWLCYKINKKEFKHLLQQRSHLHKKMTLR
ncbi:hypothetical protein M0R45_003457 [Rubus argutus]|uniref:Splicing factor cactin central domain-containing protein n=1 Tax=Rubus argutus TaxID=59490 RepID=A0AAW1YGI8_RUBAR